MPKYAVGLAYYGVFMCLIFIEQHAVKNNLADPWLCFMGVFLMFAILCAPMVHWKRKYG